MTAAFVLDASLALQWCFPDEANEHSRQLLRNMATDAAVVPRLWFLEVGNGVVVGERRGRLSASMADAFLSMIASFDLEVDDHAEHRTFTHVLDLARAHRLSTYDATYLDLALRRRLPLATADKALRDAARATGMTVLGG